MDGALTSDSGRLRCVGRDECLRTKRTAGTVLKEDEDVSGRLRRRRKNRVKKSRRGGIYTRPRS